MDDQQRPPPSVSAAELGKPPGKLPRQGPGLARVGYRNKKVKCEGKQPKCGSCAMLDVECVRATTNLPRGPRKGHLKVLQSRLDWPPSQTLFEERFQDSLQHATHHGHGSDPSMNSWDGFDMLMDSMMATNEPMVPGAAQEQLLATEPLLMHSAWGV
ncbi:hypothetical protein LTS17_009097 [Exophiala oligosperma]